MRDELLSALECGMEGNLKAGCGVIRG